MEKGDQYGKCSCLFWEPNFDEKCHRYKMCDETTDFCTFHINKTRKRHHMYVPQPDLLQNTSVCNYFRWNSLPSKKMAAAGMVKKKIATTLGLPQSTTKRWFAEAPLGGRDCVAQRWATTWQGGWCVVSCFSCFPMRFSSHDSRIARDLCFFLK